MIECAGALKFLDVIGALRGRFLLARRRLAEFLLLRLLQCGDSLLMPAGEDAVHIAQIQLALCVHTALVRLAQKDGRKPPIVDPYRGERLLLGGGRAVGCLLYTSRCV